MEHLASVEATNDAGFQRVLDRLVGSAGGGALVVDRRAAVGRRPRPAGPPAAPLRLAHDRAVRPVVLGPVGAPPPAAGARATPCCASPRDASFADTWNQAGRPGPPAHAVVERADHRRGPGHRRGRRRRLGPLGPPAAPDAPTMTATRSAGHRRVAPRAARRACPATSRRPRSSSCSSPCPSSSASAGCSPAATSPPR